MKRNYLSKIDLRLRKIILLIESVADEQKVNAFIVGGVVRDILLKRKNLDLDVVVDRDGIGFAGHVLKKLNGRLTEHGRFQTATILTQEGFRIDFSTARDEYYSKPGALPTVTKGSLRKDLFRRDFTINAMAIGVNGINKNILVDFYGGLKDLRGKKIKILHDNSFQDDPTRILRAVRFEQRFNFYIDKKTLFLLKKAVKGRYDKNVTQTRYFDELRKMFCEENADKCLRRLSVLGALSFLKPGYKIDLKKLAFLTKKLKGLKKSGYYRSRVCKAAVYFLFLFENLDNYQDVIQLFQLSSDYKKQLFSLGKVASFRKLLLKTGVKQSDIYQLLRNVDEQVIYYLYLTVGKRAAGKIDRYLKYSSLVRLEADGHYLQKMGVAPSVKVGKILEALLLEKIDGKIKNKQDEIKRINQLLNEG